MNLSTSIPAMLLCVAAALPAQAQVKPSARPAAASAASANKAARAAAAPASAGEQAPAQPRVPPFIPQFARDITLAEPVSSADCDKPVYPRASLRNEETGTVIVRIKVAADGAVIGTSVWRSSGFRDLDAAAMKSFPSCKFRPATIDGRPVVGYSFFPFVFSLQ